MTIVDSINKITTALDGNVSGARTTAKAIDALSEPLLASISGGGMDIGTAVFEMTFHPEVTGGGYVVDSIVLNGLMSYEEFETKGLISLFEIVKASFTVHDYNGNFYGEDIGMHGFNTDTINDVICEEYIEANHAPAVARELIDGVWGDWRVLA